MTTYEIVPATVDHVIELALNMRVEDQNEIWAAAHFTPWEALVSSISFTDIPYAGLADGKVLCIFGVGTRSLMSNKGVPWMLSTNLVSDHMRAWARGSRTAFEYMTRNINSLENYVDARYTSAVRWLAWLGFTVHPAEAYGMDGTPFCKFTWER